MNKTFHWVNKNCKHITTKINSLCLFCSLAFQVETNKNIHTSMMKFSYLLQQMTKWATCKVWDMVWHKSSVFFIMRYFSCSESLLINHISYNKLWTDVWKISWTLLQSITMCYQNDLTGSFRTMQGSSCDGPGWYLIYFFARISSYISINLIHKYCLQLEEKFTGWVSSHISIEQVKAPW